MEPAFWLDRWQTRQIGFHQSSVHPFLERWSPSLGVPADARVYVPLCGNTLDMVWLAVRGHRVDIIDGSPKFVEAGISSLHEVAYAVERT